MELFTIKWLTHFHSNAVTIMHEITVICNNIPLEVETCHKSSSKLWGMVPDGKVPFGRYSIYNRYCGFYYAKVECSLQINYETQGTADKSCVSCFNVPLRVCFCLNAHAIH
jgi:hypothetical protein